MKRFVYLNPWLLAFVGMMLLSLPQRSHADTKTTVATCAASPTVTTGWGFAVCVGQGLALDEIKTCLTGGDCFGENNELRKLIGTPGPNHDLFGCAGWFQAHVLGNQCPDQFGPGVITINNKTGGHVTFYASQFQDAVTINLPANYTTTPSQTWLNYRHNGPPAVGHRIRNGLTYNLEGSPDRPRLVCAILRVGPGCFINDPADPCN